MSNDDDSLPISALQHFLFCPRQCALIYLERQWEENVLTARGRLEHERVDSGYKEFRRGKRQLSGLYIRSESLQMQGRLDVLELELLNARAPDNLSVLGLKGEWSACPVEFKHGESKQNDCDRVQLCAQVICLEEQLAISIETASLFYQKIRRREEVAMDDALRAKTRQTAGALHELFQAGKTPSPAYSTRCRSCSLFEICLPQKLSKNNARYRTMIFNAQEPAS